VKAREQAKALMWSDGQRRRVSEDFREAGKGKKGTGRKRVTT